MAPKVMLASNPNRSMAIERVIMLDRTPDGRNLNVLSIDGVQNDPWIKSRFSKYFMKNVYWRFLSVLMVFCGVVLSVLWHWWIFIPAFLMAGRAVYQGKVSSAKAGLSILREHPWARERFLQHGLIWEAPAESVNAIT